MPVSFEIHPKRMVHLPHGTPTLVLIRRNVDAKISWWWNWNYRWEWARLTRLLRGDRTWRVEIYQMVSEEPINLPPEDASRVYVAADKKAAAELAERVVARLARGGLPAVDHGLFDEDSPLS